MSANSVPQSSRILIIGGGPGGSYAASCLAREGLQVVLLEAEKFPRYHVGESMLPSMRHFLRFIELEDTFESYGFTHKEGAAFHFNANKREGYSDFTAFDKGNYSWNVVRAESDALMLNHAKSSGAAVYEETKVIGIDFQDDNGKPRPISASWKDRQGNTGKISFEWLIDASGRNGVLAKHLGIRKYNQSLKNIACWGYWRGTDRYTNPLASVGPDYFEALSDESGWAWFIPLHNGTISIGVVMDEGISKMKRTTLPKEASSTRDHYLKELTRAPAIHKLIGEGTLVDDNGDAPVKSASDYSYSASSHGGINYRLVGDAGAFIDPFFSSGVHLAISGALSAAATICAAIRGDCTATEASSWHTARTGTSYTRFLLVVLSAYRQIRAQELPVLSDFDEDNFDRAFDHLRIVIQGETDVPKTLSEEELRKTIDFCSAAFAADWNDVQAGPGKEITEAHAKERAQAAQQVADASVARKMLRAEDMFAINQYIADTIDGYKLRLEKGKLGLTH